MVGPELAVLESLKSVALEATRSYRKIRTGVPLVHDQLRKIKLEYGGQLTLTEIIRAEANENEEPPDGVAAVGAVVPGHQVP